MSCIKLVPATVSYTPHWVPGIAGAIFSMRKESKKAHSIVNCSFIHNNVMEWISLLTTLINILISIVLFSLFYIITLHGTNTISIPFKSL